MKTACVLSIAVALFFSFNTLNSNARQFYVAQEQEKKKEKDETAAKVAELGTKENPVLCSGPPGERAYLSRLRCSDGKAPKFNRIGSFGEGPHGHILDGYNVKCEEKDPVTVFMDMYHDHIEKEAVPGFTIFNEEPKRVADAAAGVL